MTLAELYSFVQSSQKFIKEGKMTDRELAGFLTKSKLSERLDDRSVELLQGLGIGPKTLEALERLRDRSKTLPAGGPWSRRVPRRKRRRLTPSSRRPSSTTRGSTRCLTASGFRISSAPRSPAVTTPPRPEPGPAAGPDSEPSYQLLDTLTPA